MLVTYDREGDVVGIELFSGAHRARTERLDAGVLVHWDAEGRLIELEVLAASTRYSSQDLERIGSPVELYTLKQAHQEFGLTPSTLRVQIRAGKLRATKRGRDLLVSRAAMLTYLENRDPKGKRPRRRRSQAAQGR